MNHNNAKNFSTSLSVSVKCFWDYRFLKICHSHWIHFMRLFLMPYSWKKNEAVTLHPEWAFFQNCFWIATKWRKYMISRKSVWTTLQEKENTRRIFPLRREYIGLQRGQRLHTGHYNNNVILIFIIVCEYICSFWFLSTEPRLLWQGWMTWRAKKQLRRQWYAISTGV